jgi:hypothetical protein
MPLLWRFACFGVIDDKPRATISDLTLKLRSDLLAAYRGPHPEPPAPKSALHMDHEQRVFMERSIAKRCVSKECAKHDRQLGGESPLSSLMAAKD